MKHELKIATEYFNQILQGVKSFEIRKDDREPKYSPRDELWLREWNGAYTGRWVTADVTVVIRNEYCREGYCVMGIYETGRYPMTPQTKFDRIKRMNLDEMAAYLVHFNICDQCEYCNRCQEAGEDLECAEMYKKWLEKEVDT